MWVDKISLSDMEAQMTFSEFVERYYHKLRDYARFKCFNDPDRADDLLQETLVRIQDGTRGIDFERSPLTYSQLIMKSILMNEREGYVYLEDIGEQVEWKEFVEEGDIRRELLDEWRCNLPEKYRQVLEDLLMGLSQRQMAQQRGVSQPAINEQVRRLEKYLRTYLEARASDGGGDGQGYRERSPRHVD